LAAIFCNWLNSHLRSSGFESDAPGFRGRRFHELADGVEEGVNLSVMPTHFPFELCQFARQYLVAHSQFPELYERSHNGDIYMNGPLTAQHAREHGDTLFREYVGRVSATSSSPGF
jgi:hypothetical protein